MKQRKLNKMKWYYVSLSVINMALIMGILALNNILERRFERAAASHEWVANNQDMVEQIERLSAKVVSVVSASFTGKDSKTIQRELVALDEEFTVLYLELKQQIDRNDFELKLGEVSGDVKELYPAFSQMILLGREIVNFVAKSDIDSAHESLAKHDRTYLALQNILSNIENDVRALQSAIVIAEKENSLKIQEFETALTITAFITIGGILTFGFIISRIGQILAMDRKRLDYLKKALDASAIVAVTDARGKITFVNDKFCEISGYTRKELIGKDHRILNSGTHESSFFKKLWNQISEGHVWRGEICNRRKDGTLYWVDSTIVPGYDSEGRLNQFTAIRSDISERKQIEMEHDKKLREQEALNSLLQISTSTETSLNEKLSFAIDQIISVPWLSLLGRGGVFLVKEDQLALEVSHGLGESIESKCAKVKKGSCLCGRAFLEKRTVHASCVDERHEFRFAGMSAHGHYNIPLLQDEVVIGVIVVYLPHGHVRDESEVKFLESCAAIVSSLITAHQKELDLIESRNQAQEAYRVKSQFLANMSHEIRTPMNGIIGMANLLQDSIQDEEGLKKVGILRSCGQSLLELINDILDFSRLEFEKLEFEYIPINIRDILEEVMAIFEQRFLDKGLEFKLHIQEEVPHLVMGDQTRIKQILNNLVNNAIKFTSQGKVIVAVSSRDVSSKNIELKFSVKDSGIGIPTELQGRLFKSFSQVDASTTRKYGGTGLGLAISKSLAENMGGHMWVESEQGEGSTFFFTVLSRLAHIGTLAIDEMTEPQVDYDKSLNILLAEDNEINQVVACGILRKMGFQVDVAPNGEIALAKVLEGDFDLVLMDLHMPVMDGLEATRAICAQIPEHLRPTIIALTASSMKEDIENCFAAGMNDFISKPIIAENLTRALSTVSPRSKRKLAS